MIMSFSYLLESDPAEFIERSTKVREFAHRLALLHPTLRGVRTAQEGNAIRVTLRVAGLTRWHIQGEAPRILNILLRKLRIPLARARFESMLMEPGRRNLKDGQGRTERVRRPRSERMADGRPWDHIAWEDDETFSRPCQTDGSP